MDFTRFSVSEPQSSETTPKRKKSTKPKDTTIRATIINDKWHAVVEGRSFLIDEADLDISNHLILFRKYDWKKATMYKLLPSDKIDAIKEHWGVLCPGVKLVGNVINNKFKIDYVDTSDIKGSSNRR